MTKLSRFRFFLPNARVLEQDEISRLPTEKKKSVESAAKTGLWIEIDGLEETSIDSEGNITIPAEATSREKKGTFLELFCPDGSCEVTQMTDLP
jgi:hypothetical protein